MKAKDFFKKYKEKMVYSLAVVGALTLIMVLISMFGVSGNDVARQGMIGGFSSSESSADMYDAGVMSKATSPSISMGRPIMAEIADTLERKVVKNGSMSLLVMKAETAIEQIKGIADRLGGFVENSSLYDSGEIIYARDVNQKNNKYGSIVIRVPSKSYEEAVSGIKTLAIKVERDSTNVRDVSAEYVDIEAQLNNLRSEEEQYLSIMKKAVKVEDILNISSRLADVRGRIERMQAQFNYLSKQIEMSTISVDLRAEADIDSVTTSWRPVSVAKQAIQDMLTSLVGYADGLIIFIINIPILLIRILSTIIWLLIWLVGIFIIWKIVNYLKDRFLDK